MTLAPALWVLNVVLDTTGQVCFKAAARHQDDDNPGWRQLVRVRWLWFGLIAFAAEFIAWLAFLTVVPLSRGILLGSINIVVIMLVGRWLFAENLTGLRVAGIVLIAAGVALVGVN